MWRLLRYRDTRTHRVPEGTRVYAIGDVHGRADLLLQLLALIDSDLLTRPTARAVQVFLGDYIDRGPWSRQVIDIILERARHHELILLKGNHESYLSQFLRMPSVLASWRQVGGFETLLSYGVVPQLNAGAEELQRMAAALAEQLVDSHKAFFDRLRVSYSCGSYFFVHAGVRPGIPLERQKEQDALWIREEFLLCEENFDKMIVHGHTPVREAEYHRNRINIDTGAYATGKLTCLVLENDEAAVFST
ncbi:MAG TPA: metallophosphoesterase family protein [Gemmataceae bacterium]|nr:metallophosphoesterase family protein [Gemmataceae bacterium]